MKTFLSVHEDNDVIWKDVMTFEKRLPMDAIYGFKVFRTCEIVQMAESLGSVPGTSLGIELGVVQRTTGCGPKLKKARGYHL